MGTTPIVTLRIGLTSVGALSLDKNSLKRGACAAIGDHYLLGVVEHLGIVHFVLARVLVLLLALHVGLALLVDAVTALFFVHAASLN